MKIRVLLGACLLAALSSAAFGLGLGEILVKSKLNQPLDAEIVVRESTPGEADQLLAKLASQEDFARLGLERARMPVMVRFDTAKNDRGQTIIRVRSDEPVREPFLTLLVEANWSGGRLLREYGLLLDPPVAAPSSSLTRVAAPPPAPAQTQALAETPPPSPEPPPVETVAEAPAPAPTPAPAEPTPAPAAPAPAARPSAPPPPGFAAPPGQRPATPAPAAEAPASAPAAALDDSYTVQRGDTLSSIARGYAEAAGVTTNQMMLAIQRDNPRAFFNENINALRAGAVLRIPDADTATSMRASEASAEVRRQNSGWTGVASLADAGSSRPTATQGRPAASAEDRLELLPPGREGSGDQAAGRAGADQGGVNVAGLQSDLQRAREDLRSRDQELSELTSRVRDLEELNAKNSRLLELKNTELAELQRRLAETTSAAPPAAVAVPAPIAEPEAPVADEPTESVDIPATALEPEAADPQAEDDFASDAGPEGEAEVAGLDDAQPQTEAEWESETGVASDDPFAEEDAADTAAGDTWTPAEPASATPAPATTPVVQTPPATPVQSVQAPAVAEPWYMNPLIQGGALVAIALILLLLLLSRRKRRSDVAVSDSPRRSVADLFGESAAAGAVATEAVDETLASETQALVEQIEADPNDFGAYLELLSIHYSNSDAEQFEYWAQRFHDRPGSEISEEWQSVRVMGNELLAGNALFAAASQAERQVWSPDDDIDVGLPELDEPATPVAAEPEPGEPARQVYDISGASFEETEQVTEQLGEDAAPIDFDPNAFSSAQREPEPTFEAPAATADDDDKLEFSSGDEDIGTKLQDELSDFASQLETTVSAAADGAGDVVEDVAGGLDDAATKLELARAYLDMGDPEGARAMLEEVLGEGDTSQREAARKLLASL